MRPEQVIIVGSGPAGYTAALYAARADLRPLVFEGYEWGGLLQTTTDVENFPGYPDGVLGPAMMQDLRDQAERFGARLEAEEVTEINLARDGGLHQVKVGAREMWTESVILAMGAEPKKLGVPGEAELAARGVSYCATCDGVFFRDKQVAVVGGGDTAMEDALFLSRFAANVKVVHRRDEFRASAIMLERAMETENLELLTPYRVDELLAGDQVLAGAELVHSETGEASQLAVDGMFVAIGHRPNSQLVAGQVPVDDEGYVLVDSHTSVGVPGVFAAGDLVDRRYRQAVTAAGTGCMASIDAERYLAARHGR